MRVRAKQVLLNIVAATPALRAVRRLRDQIRPSNDVDATVQGILDRLRVRREKIGDERIRGGDLLEIGSGVEFGLALLLVHLGARRVVNVEIDPHDFVWRSALYRLLVERARRSTPSLDLGWPPEGLIEEPGGKVVRPDPAKITLHLGRSAASMPEQDESFDVTFSVSVLQHIRRKDLPRVASELYRLTRPGGVGYHRIDLRDLESPEPFGHLQYTEKEYLLMYGNRRAYTNRFRMDDLRAIFQRAGFPEVRFEDIKLYEDEERFDKMRPFLAEEFRKKDRAMLLARSCMLVLRR